jgi:hypothetical protein
MTLPPLNPVYAGLGTTIFTSMSALAAETGALNLGQGFPETDGFPEVREAAARALTDSSNQYAPMKGQGALLEAVAGFYGRTQGLSLDPTKNVLITSGATEALAASVFSLISPGDEVIVFEPHYDAYAPLIERAGGGRGACAPQPARLALYRGATDQSLFAAHAHGDGHHAQQSDHPPDVARRLGAAGALLHRASGLCGVGRGVGAGGV